jgi:hypothetical protein
MQKLVSSGKPTDLSADILSPVSNFLTAVPRETVKEIVKVAVHWCFAASSDPGFQAQDVTIRLIFASLEAWLGRLA